MDDPLIGLTLYDSRRKLAASGPGRPVRRQSKEMVDSNKVYEQKLKSSSSVNNKKPSSHKSVSKDYRVANTTAKKHHHSKRGGSKAAVSDDLDKCFPCLPGIEDQEDKEREKRRESSLSSLSDASTPNSPTHEEGGGCGRTTPKPIDSERVVDSNVLMNSPVPQPQNYWLMRLFQSKLFDMSIAIGYLFNSKDSDVQGYLGNKLFVSWLFLFYNIQLCVCMVIYFCKMKVCVCVYVQ